MRAPTAVLLGLAFVLGGAMFGSPSLYPPGIALVLIPLLAAGWVRLAALRLQLRREVPEGPLIEGVSYPLVHELSRGLVPAPGGVVADPLLEEPRPLTAGRIEAGVSFARRGRRELGFAEAVVSDPFGLSEARRRTADAGAVVVLPRTEPIELTARGRGGRSLGFGERGAGGVGPDSWAAEFEIDGLRPYREGTPAARIHWPTVARTGELHERRITAGAGAARLVVLDPQRPLGEAELDAAVRAAASICLELAPGGGCSLIVGSEPRVIEIDSRLRGWPAAHHRLALVEADSGAPATRRIGRAGIVFWVSADLSAAAERRCRGLAAVRRVLVRPRPEGSGGSGRRAAFRVAGCEGIELSAAGRGRRRAEVPA
jgi:uncharacterized protein (DUF58 family)